MDNELKEAEQKCFSKIRHFLCMTEYDANLFFQFAFQNRI